MLAFQCPRCAAPIAISPAAPEWLRCARCGHEGSMPADAAARLTDAQRLLERLDHSALQLSAAQRRSLTAGVLHTFIYIGFSSVLAAPVVLTGILLLVVVLVWGGRVSGFLLLVSFTPLCAVAGVGALGLGTIRARRRRLEAACAADPPDAPGEPARCHVCGAPLTGNRSVVRCGHCEADNLVEPAAIRRVHRERAAGIDDLERRLTREVEGVRAASASATIGTAFGAAFAPLLAIGLAVVTGAVLRLMEFPADPALRYALVDDCVVDGTAVRAADLVGRRVRDHFSFDTPLVDAVYLDPVMDEQYLRATHARATTRRPILGTCFAGPGWGVTLAAVTNPRQVQVVGEDVWVLAADGDRRLQRVPLAGGPAVSMPVDAHTLDIAVVGGRVETGRNGEEVEAGPGGVYRAGHDGVSGPAGRLATVTGQPVGLSVLGDDLYWFDRDPFAKDAAWGTADLRAVATAGGEVRTLAARVRIPDEPSLGLAGDRVLWITRDHAIVAVPRAGGAVEVVRPAEHPISRLRVTGDTLWWWSGAGIVTRPLAGGPEALVVPSFASVEDFVVTDRWIVGAQGSGLDRVIAVERSAITTRPSPRAGPPPAVGE